MKNTFGFSFTAVKHQHSMDGLDKREGMAAASTMCVAAAHAMQHEIGAKKPEVQGRGK